MTIMRAIAVTLGVAYIVIGFIGTVECTTVKRRVGELVRTLALIIMTYYVCVG